MLPFGYLYAFVFVPSAARSDNNSDLNLIELKIRHLKFCKDTLLPLDFLDIDEEWDEN